MMGLRWSLFVIGAVVTALCSYGTAAHSKDLTGMASYGMLALAPIAGFLVYLSMCGNLNGIRAALGIAGVTTVAVLIRNLGIPMPAVFHEMKLSEMMWSDYWPHAVRGVISLLVICFMPMPADPPLDDKPKKKVVKESREAMAVRQRLVEGRERKPQESHTLTPRTHRT